MTRALSLLLASPLLLAALLPTPGCTFERRPPAEGSEGVVDGGAALADGGADSLAGSADGTALDSARIFLEELQRIRASGSPGELQRRLHPEAVILPAADRGRSGDGGGAEAVLPALDGAGEPWRVVLEDASLPGPSMLFVIRYPGEGPEERDRLETILLIRDEGRWSLRLLHRGPAEESDPAAPPEPAGPPDAAGPRDPGASPAPPGP